MRMLVALADCNNFFVSCERVFAPHLERVPVAVMSNNDGCIVARSNEVKKLGVPMGSPVHQYLDVFKKNNVTLFSANFALYGDLSNRVMRTLAQFTPEIEIYSIDEAFLSLDGFDGRSLDTYCREIRKTVKQWTGIPVSVGAARTKTLAKLANERAKKDSAYDGVLDLSGDEKLIAEVLSRVPVEDIWGIGGARTEFLKRNGVHTALDLRNASDKWIRQNMSVMGQRTVWELRGEPCFGLEEFAPPKKNIACTRSFGRPVSSLRELKESVALYVTRAAEKLRGQGSAANLLQVFIRTNRFHKDAPQYYRWATIVLPVASNYTPDLISCAMKGLERIFVSGFEYHKAGVIFGGLVRQDEIQLNLFYDPLPFSDRNQRFIRSIDRLNRLWGRETVKPAASGLHRGWRMKQNSLSPRYTTDWNSLPVAKAG